MYWSLIISLAPLIFVILIREILYPSVPKLFHCVIKGVILATTHSEHRDEIKTVRSLKSSKIMKKQNDGVRGEEPHMWRRWGPQREGAQSLRNSLQT